MSRRARQRYDKRDLPEVLERYASLLAPIEEPQDDESLADSAWLDAIAEANSRGDILERMSYAEARTRR